MGRAFFAGLVAVLSGMMAAACPVVAQSSTSLPQLSGSSESAAHPLALKFATVGDRSRTSALADDPDRFLAPLLASPIVFLGEVHDNADHHALRGWLAANIPEIRRHTAGGLAGPAVVFEQLSTDKQPAIDAFMALPKESRTLDAFFKAVDWDKSGWAKYDYRPLFQSVLDAGLPIYAGDAPRDLIRKAAREGATALPAAEQKRLGLDVPLDPSLHDASLTEIEASHCGLMPRTAFGGMAFAQRVRDATLADVALGAMERHGSVIVIAGNGHVRSDRGAPWYIRQRAPATAVSTTMLIEAEADKTDPEDYVPRGPDGKPAADTILFTPRIERPDPCEEMRKSFAPRPN